MLGAGGLGRRRRVRGLRGRDGGRWRDDRLVDLLDRHLSGLIQEEEDLLEPRPPGVREQVDRPGQQAIGRVQLLQGRDGIDMGRDPCVAQLAQLVEEPEGVDPVAEEIGPGAKLDPIAARCPIGRHRRLGLQVLALRDVGSAAFAGKSTDCHPIRARVPAPVRSAPP